MELANTKQENVTELVKATYRNVDAPVIAVGSGSVAAEDSAMVPRRPVTCHRRPCASRSDDSCPVPSGHLARLLHVWPSTFQSPLRIDNC